MKKQTLSKKQIEDLKTSLVCTVRYHHNEYQMISDKLQQIDKFLKAAADLYLIDYSEIAPIMKEIGEAGLKELEAIRAAEA